MNKAKIFIPLLAAAMILTAFGYVKLSSNSNSPYGVKATPGIEMQSLVEYKNLEDVIKVADNIIVGYVQEENDFDGNTIKRFKVKVERNLKGDTKSDNIFEYDDKFQTGIKPDHRYSMFLEYYESPVFPHPIYTLCDKDAVFEISNGSLISASKKSETYLSVGNTEEKLTKYILKSPSLGIYSEKDFNVVDEISDVNKLAEISDYVSKVAITEFDVINEYAFSIIIKVLDTFKGKKLDESRQYQLPANSNVKVGEEYVLFLKGGNDGAISVVSRKGSVLDKGSKEKWETVHEKFNK